MSNAANEKGARLIGLVRKIVLGWTLVGGGVLLAVVAMQSLSAVTGVFGHPLQGDFELTQMGVAIAVFAFLPYCQLTDANVTADIFTAGAGPKAIAFLNFLSSLIALAFAVVMAWRTWYGMEDQFAYNYRTTILSVPIGLAYIPVIVSLVLLAIAAVVTLGEAGSGLHKSKKSES